jgi:hypothetical protein
LSLDTQNFQWASDVNKSHYVRSCGDNLLYNLIGFSNSLAFYLKISYELYRRTHIKKGIQMKTLTLFATLLLSTLSFASDRIRACNSLSSRYISACLTGGQTSAESIKACDRLSSNYIIDCLSGPAKSPEVIQACDRLSSRYISACLLGNLRSADEIKACDSLSSSHIPDCLKGPRDFCVPNTVTLPKFSK